ncbi:hypothetical protein lerEdw1_005681 [Lerista edwardsae]|nr:hypothetical protein lerEdw1_005681 [Lerista edwardsae]
MTSLTEPHSFPSDVPDLFGKHRKSKKKMAEQKKSQSLEEPISEGPRNGPNPPLSRSKTYDPSFSKEVEKEAVSSAVSNLMKHTANFHRVFKDLPEEEALLDSKHLIAQQPILVFILVIIPVPTISVLKKANTALLVPNAISIRTTEGEKDGSRNGSPNASHTSSEHLLKISLTSKEADPSRNLPEHEMLPEMPGREQVKKSSARWWDNLNMLNIVILIYLFLVVVLLLCSGYIGLRIVQLEEQLTSMGAWPELDLQHRYKTT